MTECEMFKLDIPTLDSLFFIYVNNSKISNITCSTFIQLNVYVQSCYKEAILRELDFMSNHVAPLVNRKHARKRGVTTVEEGHIQGGGGVLPSKHTT